MHPFEICISWRFEAGDVVNRNGSGKGGVGGGQRRQKTKGQTDELAFSAEERTRSYQSAAVFILRMYC